MSRGARKRSITDIYHVIGRGLNRNFIFSENREKRRFISLIRENLSQYDVVIYAYCIMPNHFHLLIKADIKELSSFMAKVLAAYAQYYNFKHDRIGYVFQDRFKSQCIEEENYFWNCMRYIHLNPSKERAFNKISKYKFSSFYEFYRDKRDIVHENAFIIKSQRFLTTQHFLSFHQIDNRDVFSDTEEDTNWNNLRVARAVLFDMKWHLGISEKEILEYIDTRRLFEDVLMKSLGVSRRKAEDIRVYLRKEYIETT